LLLRCLATFPQRQKHFNIRQHVSILDNNTGTNLYTDLSTMKTTDDTKTKRYYWEEEAGRAISSARTVFPIFAAIDLIFVSEISI